MKAPPGVTFAEQCALEKSVNAATNGRWINGMALAILLTNGGEKAAFVPMLALGLAYLTDVFDNDLARRGCATVTVIGVMLAVASPLAVRFFP